MTFFKLPIRSPRVRASAANTIASHSSFHGQSVGGGEGRGGSRRSPLQPFGPRRELTLQQSSSELWFAKVVSTLCVVFQSRCLDDRVVDYLSQTLTPLVACEVVRRMEIPKLAFWFLEFSISKLNMNHSYWTYDHLLRCFCQWGIHDMINSVFQYMRIDGHLPDSWLVGLLVGSLAEAGRFYDARKLLAQAERDGVGLNPFVYNKYLSILVGQDRLDEAIGSIKVCARLQSCFDTCTFNILIRGLCRAGDLDAAFKLFGDMGSFGCFPDVVTYNTLIDGFCRVNKVDEGHELLNQAQRTNVFLPDVRTYTTIIFGYCKMGKMEEAARLFSEMKVPEVRPTSVTFNVLIDGYGKLGNMALAHNMYEKMLFLGCSPDVVTFSSLIDGYCRADQVNEALKLWKEMGSRKLPPNAYTFVIIIHALCKENRLLEAREFLVQMKWWNITPLSFIYNPVIDGFCRVGNVDEANRVVTEMEERKCHPDKITFTILIIGHCVKGRMGEAINLFNKMLVVNCALDTVSVNCLISCLLKAGMVSDAMQIKKKLVLDNVNLMQSSCSRNIPVRTSMEIPVAA